MEEIRLVFIWKTEGEVASCSCLRDSARMVDGERRLWCVGVWMKRAGHASVVFWLLPHCRERRHGAHDEKAHVANGDDVEG